MYPNEKSYFGCVKWFDPAKGFGFVVDAETGDEVLLHVNTLREFGVNTIAKEVVVGFLIERTDRGVRVAKILEIRQPEDVVTYDNLTTEVQDKLEPSCVKWFDAVKGYGFVMLFRTNEEIFIHADILRKFGMGELLPGVAVVVVVDREAAQKQVTVIQPWKFIH
jgi:CspA family cold shock protein